MPTIFDQYFDKEKVADPIPAGGNFAPSGLIAPVRAATCYQVYISGAELQDEDAKKYLYDTRRNRQDDGGKYYFSSQAVAQEIATRYGLQFGPQSVWYFVLNRDEVVNFNNEKTKNRFSSSVSYSARVNNWFSAKYRHEFHLIALPSAVHALAKASGLDVPDWHVNELFDNNTTLDEAFQNSYIGSSTKNPDNEFHYTKSVLFERRKQLWAALGEDNPLLCEPNTVAPDKKLHDVLGVYHYEWKSPLWTHIAQVKDPHMPSEGKERYSVPVILDFYAGETEARASVAKKGVEEEIEVSSEQSAKPAMPAAWLELGVDDEAAWLEALGVVKTKLGGSPTIPLVLATKLASEQKDSLMATGKEIAAWWPFA